ncbi:MAG: hypothetical protein ACI867_001462 [Glaciecola sp.]|jgi:hypothetical protein
MVQSLLDSHGMLRGCAPSQGEPVFSSWGWSFEVGGVDHAHRPTLSGPTCVRPGERPGTWTGSRADVAWEFDRPTPGVVRGRWSVTNTSDEVQNIGSMLIADLLLAQRFDEVFDLRVSGDVPLAIVARDGESSVLIVSENPLVQFEIGDLRWRITGRANLRLEPGATLAGEPIYVVSVPRRSGDVIGRCLPKADGSLPDRGGLPNPRDRVLDQTEVDALRGLLAWRIPRRREDNAFLDMDWVNALHPGVLGSPNNTAAGAVEEMQEQHRELFREMEELGIGRVVLDQCFAATLDGHERQPIPQEQGWDIDPRAQPVVDEARARGLRIGLYNGCGNWPKTWPAMFSSSTAFLQDHNPEWKIHDADGDPVVFPSAGHPVLAPDPGTRTINCLAHRPFRRWYIDLISTTIERHGLTWWGWDVDDAWQLTIGSCLASDHDHGPGDTVYSLWRAMREVEGELRDRHPDLVIMNYWGRKSLGPFGLVDSDINENSCEYLPVWPKGGQIAQMLGDRVDWRFGWWDEHLAWPSANDLRLQYWVNAVDRLLPNHLGYGVFNTDLVELVAAIGTGAMVAVYDTVPEPERKAVAAWFAFNDREQAQLSSGRPAWGPPRRGGVDGWWHHEPDRALAFLFNPNAEAISVEVPVLDRPSVLRALTPEPGAWLSLRGGVEQDSAVAVEVAATSWLVLEVLPASRLRAGDAVVEHGSGDHPQPFAWSRAHLDAYTASLPDFPLELTRSNMTQTSLYPNADSSGARAL